MDRTEWLSRSAAELAIDFLKGNGPHCDVAIVGSGYGGAVAAARLAGATDSDGKTASVWVLERGREFLPGSFPERFADLPAQVRVNFGEEVKARGELEGLFDLRIGKHVSTLLGNGLGGGSLINAGVLAEPNDAVLNTWPPELHGNALAPFFLKAKEMLGASKMPGPTPAKLAAIEMIGRKLDGCAVDRRADIAVSFADGGGPDATNRWGVRQRACIGCGDCFSGCNHSSKNTLATNYLALARRRGAELFTGITVLKVREAHWGGEDGWDLELCITDRKVDRRFQNGEAIPLRLRARHVILAAGVYGSTGILLRSQRDPANPDPDALDLSSRIGKGFSTNGDMIAVGYRMPSRINASAQETIEPERRDIGPTITGMIDLRTKREGLVIEELAIPAILRRMFEETVTTFGSLHGLAQIDWTRHRRDDLGGDPAAIDPEAVARTAVYATMGHDGSNGEIVLIEGEGAERSDDCVRVQWEGVAGELVFADAVKVLERAHAGTGATVIPNPLWRLLPASLSGMLDEAPKASVFTVHPLGGSCLASRVEEGVVNCSGQVFKRSGGLYSTLAVLDGSIVPGSLGINPCLTIAALAEKASLELAKAWKLAPLDDSDFGRPLGNPPPLLPWPRQRPAHRPTAIRLAERLVGEVHLPVAGHGALQRAGASLEIEYGPVPNLEAFMNAQPKILRLARGRLTLTGTVQASGVMFNKDVAIRGQLRLLVREDATALARIRRAAWAWFWNRGLRDLWQRLAGPRRHGTAKSTQTLWQRIKGFFRFPAKIWSYVHGLLAMASHAGEIRRIEYELEVLNDVEIPDASGGSVRLLSDGDRLSGVKRLCYDRGARPGSNPWNQLTRLSLCLDHVGDRTGREITKDPLQVDLPYFALQYATQLQFARQQNQPAAIADLLSFAAYLGRALGKIHIWNFRAPDYPEPFPVYVPGDFDARRLPGKVEGLEHDVTRVRPDPQRDDLFILLTRYWSGKQPKPGKPVLLIHGFGASGTTFTLGTVDKNLVQHLVEQGFDPWVLDLRTSIGLPSSGEEWMFDEVAFQDIHAAIQTVSNAAGCRVYVIAHCVGAAMFCMAALAGHLSKKGQLVRAAVLSQVGPLLELPPLNRFRGYLASYLKHYFDFDRLNVTGELDARNRVIDRLLAAYPYPEREWRAHHPKWFWNTEPHEVYCNRASAIYGRLFEHDNLNEKTLERFGELIGHVNYRTYQQTINYATMRRLTNNLGRNVYVTFENIRSHFNFPVCFLHGKENDVFDVRTSRRSFDLLASIFWTKDLEGIWNDRTANRAEYSQYADGNHLRLLEIGGYGHQDCMIGKNAHVKVFPEITAFLEQAPDEAPTVATMLDVVRPARMGPIVGWLRRGQDRRPTVRLLFVPNSSRSEPLYAMTIVLRQGKPVPHHAKFHPLKPDAPTQALDVELPRDLPQDCHVVVVTVHKEAFEGDPKSDVGKPREDDPFGEDLDRFPLLRRPFPDSAEDPEADPYAEAVLACCKDLGIDREPLLAGRRVCDARYATPVSVAIVSKEALQAAEDGKADAVRLSFALGSCRYAAAVTDRELADQGFGRLRDLLARNDNLNPLPQLLFLAGDQIYADATAGLFDPTSGVERFDQRYLEAWTAPNAREVLRRVPVYPMLDDHEVEENWEGRHAASAPDNAALGKQAFVHHQLLLGSRFKKPRSYDPKTKDYWYRVNAGGFRFFVADTRTGRQRGSGPLSADSKILAKEQMDALKSWLLDQHVADASKPKFVVSPSVVAPWSRSTCGHRANALRSDAWDGFPDSLHALLHFIGDAQIRNVVFLSGDYHSSVFCELSVATAGKDPVQAFSIVSSGLYSPYPFANTRAEDLQLSFRGTHAQWQGIQGDAKCCEENSELRIEYAATPYTAQDSFALITVEKAKAQWRLEMQCNTEDGVVRNEIFLK